MAANWAPFLLLDLCLVSLCLSPNLVPLVWVASWSRSHLKQSALHQCTPLKSSSGSTPRKVKDIIFTSRRLQSVKDETVNNVNFPPEDEWSLHPSCLALPPVVTWKNEHASLLGFDSAASFKIVNFSSWAPMLSTLQCYIISLVMYLHKVLCVAVRPWGTAHGKSRVTSEVVQSDDCIQRIEAGGRPPRVESSHCAGWPRKKSIFFSINLPNTHCGLWLLGGSGLVVCHSYTSS